jgi:hypothetical protein
MSAAHSTIQGKPQQTNKQTHLLSSQTAIVSAGMTKSTAAASSNGLRGEVSRQEPSERRFADAEGTELKKNGDQK